MNYYAYMKDGQDNNDVDYSTLDDNQLIQEIARASLAAPISSNWEAKVRAMYLYCKENDRLDLYQKAYELARSQAVVND